MFLSELVIGTIMICATVVIHAVALDRLITVIEKWKNHIRLAFKRYWKIPVLVFAVLGTFLAHVVQIWMWAVFYLKVGALPELEDALYFSTSTFTTVGYGDVVLGEKWRLISSFQAANGFMLFGWSTAFISELMSRLYEGESRAY